MKISNIYKQKYIYYVTFTPNLIQRLFGLKERVERYKTRGEVFHYFPHILVFYKESGEICSPIRHEKICKALNNYVNRF
jgi:hypothetical protein